MLGAQDLAGLLRVLGNHRGTTTRRLTGTLRVGASNLSACQMPIEIRITGEPEELAQLLRSWGPGQLSGLRAALELAIANAPSVAEDEGAPAAVRKPASASPLVRLPVKPPNQWREEEMIAVVMESSIAEPDFPGLARATLLAMGAQRLADLSRCRYAEFVEAMGEASPTLRAALEQAPWRRRKP